MSHAIGFLQWYLSVGCAIYIVAFIGDAFNKFKGFRKADLISVCRGLLGIPLWPLVILCLAEVGQDHE